MKSVWRQVTVVFALALTSISWAQESDQSLLAKLALKNHIALMRHAIAPGTGDPGHFDVKACETQRNLDETGRQQARDTGRFLQNNGLGKMQVFSSQWCRCLETATLLDVGEVQELPALNSFFATMHLRDESTRRLKDWLVSQPLDQPLMLVTHQVNITALTGVYPASGELVILHRDDNGELSVAGTIDPR